MHITEIIEPVPLSTLQWEFGNVAGDLCWVPYRGIDDQTLLVWLESADMYQEGQWYAALIREELKRRRGVWQWWAM